MNPIQEAITGKEDMGDLASPFQKLIEFFNFKTRKDTKRYKKINGTDNDALIEEYAEKIEILLRLCVI